VADPASEWQALSDAFARFSRHIDQAVTVNVNANALRGETRAVAQQWFRQARPVLQDVLMDDQLAVLNSGLQSLLELSERPNLRSSYKRQIKLLRKLMPKVSSYIEINSGVDKVVENTTEDARLIKTLEGLVPSAALSYRQAIIDLADDRRVSFRGPALELREALRGTLDHLAPDEDVMGEEGFKLEKDVRGPTMKQKVRFIMKARGQRRAATAPEQTATTIEEMVGTLTRSVYTIASIATHVGSERKSVIQIRRYVVAVLHDILEL
jgi:hypothetical protein